MTKPNRGGEQPLVYGLPGPLPSGESILWQGSPKWTSIARHLCHVRTVFLYFGALMTWRVIATAMDGRPMVEAVQINIWLSLLLAATVGLLCLFAWALARSTVYTITTARVAMRFGIALQKDVNLPFGFIESVGLRQHSNGTGDIPILLTAGQKISYLALWPHARPFRFKQPEPMLRGVTDPADVAKILSGALSAYTGAMSNSKSLSDRNEGDVHMTDKSVHMSAASKPASAAA